MLKAITLASESTDGRKGITQRGTQTTKGIHVKVYCREI